MTRLEQAITNIVDVFMEYAAKDESDDETTKSQKKKLSPEELKSILETEIKSPDFQDKITADDIEEAMKTLDNNHDGEVNFREFCRCVSLLAKSLYNKRTKSGGAGKKGKGKRHGAEEED